MPDIIDLFAGTGGLSLGAARAGFNLKAAVEKDSTALYSHRLNFPGCKHLDADIGKLKGKDLLSASKIKNGELSGLIGGPPCQGFSIMGRQLKDDHRNNLFAHFFRLVNETRPSFFVAENVPGILNENYDDLRKAAFTQVESDYALLDPFFVKASDYGAPTIRKRVFFIGYDPKRISVLTAEDFRPTEETEATTVEKALRGLPETISSDWLKEEDGWHTTVKKTDSVFMRKIVGEIPEGVGNENALKRYTDKSEVSSCQGTRHTPEVQERYRKLARGKQDKISKSVKLDPKGYCPTLRAGTGSDKGSYQAVRPIHHNEPRVITPREAARLQGFPDWFVFHPTKWHSFRQIGNSVSPIVAEYLLKIIFDSLGDRKPIASV
ncbi:MAG: DNA cytosine methyltransferase [Pyrinomonadaceae bacterium]